MKQIRTIIGIIALVIFVGGAVAILSKNDNDGDNEGQWNGGSTASMPDVRPNPHDPSTLKPGTNTGGSVNVGGTVSTGGTSSQSAGTYTMAQVSAHNSASSCWTAINGSVYDVTAWINQHPGGAQAILILCGTDGSGAFNGQHGGQRRPEQELAAFRIGVLSQ